MSGTLKIHIAVDPMHGELSLLPLGAGGVNSAVDFEGRSSES